MIVSEMIHLPHPVYRVREPGQNDGIGNTHTHTHTETHLNKASHLDTHPKLTIHHSYMDSDSCFSRTISVLETHLNLD